MTLRHLGFSLILAILLTPFAANAQKVGLVLSGGGAKGIAHIGVIKALEENDIPIDYVTGTSMGAIIGGFYACGYSPEQMLALVESKGFHYWSTGKIDDALTYYFSKPEPTPRLLSIQLNFKDTTHSATADILPDALINPLPMAFEFMNLFAPYTAQSDSNFNRLFVPFRCVTSDVYHKRKIVCRDGSLGDAIRASMTFPMVFKPIEMDSVLVYDGGIYDNFPVDVMREDFHPDFIIGSNVSGPDAPPQQGNMFGQLEDMIIQNNDYSLPAREGVKIDIPVRMFGVLDFDKAQTIYNIGYKTGLAMVDSIKSRLSARRDPQVVASRRTQWNAATPPLIFGDMTTTGVSPSQARYIKYIFEDGHKGRQFSVDQARYAYYRLISSGKVTDMFPQARYNPSSGLFNLDLAVTPKRKWSAGFGGWLTSSTNSFLYLTLGYHTLSLSSLDADLSGWLGQSYMAGMANAKFTLHTWIPSALTLRATISRRKYYDSDVLFLKTSTPAFVTRDDVQACVLYGMGFTRPTKAEIGLGWEYERNSFYPSDTHDFANTPRSHARYQIWGARLGTSTNTLNNSMYPSLGHAWSAYLWGLHERVDKGLYHRWRAQILLSGTRYFPLPWNLSLGTHAEAFATLGRLNGNYYAELVHSPEFGPTPSTRHSFNAAFRAYNYAALGVMPVWQPIDNLQIRGDFYLYAPLRGMHKGSEDQAVYHGWIPRVEFLGEMAAIYNFSFASLALYGNYKTGVSKPWNFGIAFGLSFEAPRFFR